MKVWAFLANFLKRHLTKCSTDIKTSAYLLLQVFAIEFGDFAMEYVPFAIEFVTFAIEFVPFALTFVPFAVEFVGFRN